jgi:hypothetical protein
VYVPEFKSILKLLIKIQFLLIYKKQVIVGNQNLRPETFISMEVLHRIQEWLIINDPSRPLNLKNLNLEELPILPGNIEILDCSNNQLISLRNLPSSLKVLNCTNNRLNLHLLSENELTDFFNKTLKLNIRQISY